MKFERYLVMEKQKPIKKRKKDKDIVDKIRKPVPPPSQHHGDKKKYDRREKHKKDFS